MASIDRYRPAGRESYQPPSLPPKPPPPSDRQSRSPTRRHGAALVPPAAPSPPVHSSRNSPPRPGMARRGPLAASPLRPPATPAPKPRKNSQWFFTPDEIRSTPSIADGLRPADERMRRAKGVSFIYQAGVLLELPQITLWVAAVFFHRFFMRVSLVEEKGGVHHYVSQTLVFQLYLFHVVSNASLSRISLQPLYSWRTRHKKIAARPRTSSFLWHASPKRTQTSSSMNRARSTGAGGTAS